MSFREKTAWVSLVCYLGFYGNYFLNVADGLLSGGAEAVIAGTFDTAPYYDLLGDMLILLIAAEVAIAIALAIWAPKEADAPADERERMISLKATRNAFNVVMVGAVSAAAGIGFGVPVFFMVNVLFFSVVLAEVVRFAGQIFYFRRGA